MLEQRIAVLEAKVKRLEEQYAENTEYAPAEEVATEVSRRLNQIRSDRAKRDTAQE